MSATSDMASGRLRGLVDRVRGALSSSGDGAKASRAAAAALVIRVANAVLAYAAQVVLARLMGQFEYGVFAFTWVWFLVFGSVATLGFGDSAVRFLPAMRERGEADRLRGFLLLGAGASVAVAALAALVAMLALPLAEGHIDSAYLLPMMLMAAVLPFACLQSFLEGVGRSYLWTVPALAPIYIMRHGLLLVFMAAAVWTGFEASAATAFVCVILTVGVSLAYQLAAIGRRLQRVLEPGPRAYRPREWILGSLPFSVMFGAAHLFAFTDVLVLSFFVSPAEIAVYFAATRVMQAVALIPFAATVGTAQLIAASHAAGDLARMRRLIGDVAVWTFAAALAVTLAVAFGGGWLLALFGAGFDDGYPALLILAAGMMIKVATGPAEDVLNMTGHSRLSAGSYVAAIAVNVALNVALIVPFGIVGAAMATSIAIALRAVWLAVAARRRLGVATWVFAARASPAALADRRGGERKGTASPAE